MTDFRDDDAFLRAILAEPDDESLRLVYADWLEEQGDPRGEFLRAESELLGLSKDAAGYNSLKSRVRKLRAKLPAQWLEQIEQARLASQRNRVRCRVCGQQLPARDAIAVHPINRTKLKHTRYCRSCWEDAVRAQMRRELRGPGGYDSHSYGGYAGSAQDED